MLTQFLYKANMEKNVSSYTYVCLIASHMKGDDI